jgi:drug/metabolite transporter (DMT)-like permease
MILFSFFGSLMIAGIVAVLFERWGWTHNGILPSVFIAFGAVLVLYFLRALFGLSFGSPGVDAIIGSAAALILIPTEYAHRRRTRNRRR